MIASNPFWDLNLETMDDGALAVLAADAGFLPAQLILILRHLET